MFVGWNFLDFEDFFCLELLRSKFFFPSFGQVGVKIEGAEGQGENQGGEVGGRGGEEDLKEILSQLPNKDDLVVHNSVLLFLR